MEDKKILLNLHCAEWDRWMELEESAELRELIQTANAKLRQGNPIEAKETSTAPINPVDSQVS